MNMQNRKGISVKPLSQMGVFVSICVFLVLIIKSAIFGFSWAAIAWLLFILVYWCLCYIFIKKRPNEKLLKFSTIGFLIISVITLVDLALFDKNARPKMHAFEGAASDSVEVEEEFVVDETPDITIVQQDTTKVDSVRMDTTTSVAPAVQEPVEDMGDDGDTDSEVY